MYMEFKHVWKGGTYILVDIKSLSLPCMSIESQEIKECKMFSYSGNLKAYWIGQWKSMDSFHHS